MRGLYYAHSGIRYLVLAFGLVALLYAVLGLLRRQPYDRSMKVLASAFAGSIHLQILIGLALLLTGRFGPSVGMHFVLMAFAAAAAQIPSSVMRRRPPEERSYGPHAVLTVVALALVWLGIVVIGRPLLGMANL